MRWTEEECDAGFECGQPGTYEVEVIEVKEKTTEKNDQMWALKFKDVQTGETVCFDNLVFSKKGQGIAKTKMRELGVTKGDDGFYECDSQGLIGLRTNLTLVVDTYKGKDKLVPDFNADNFGYGESDIPF